MPSAQDWERAAKQRWCPGRKRDNSSWDCWLQKVPSLILNRGTGMWLYAPPLSPYLNKISTVILPFVSKFAKLLCLTCAAPCSIWSSMIRIRHRSAAKPVTASSAAGFFFCPCVAKEKAILSPSSLPTDIPYSWSLSCSIPRLAYL